jgi:hypothetical protein
MLALVVDDEQGRMMCAASKLGKLIVGRWGRPRKTPTGQMTRKPFPQPLLSPDSAG